MSTDNVNAGQLLVFGFDGTTIPGHIKSLIKRNALGGVILFPQNRESTDDIKLLTRRLKNNSPLQPLVFIDQEGGRISRMIFKGEVNYSAGEFVRIDDIELFENEMRRIAQALHRCGIDVNTIPVLDIPSHGDIPVLEDRCYGNTPEQIIKYSSIIINSYRECGILSCAKHFPGLGDVSMDPHNDMPLDQTDQSQYYNHKFIPFINAIKHDVPMIMTTHIVADALDENTPVTFSKKTVDGILRRELEFEGIIVSDDLEMGAIAKNYSWEDAIYRTIRAGHHLLLICHSDENQLAAIEHIEKLINSDKKFHDIVEKAADKVIRFKTEYFKRKQNT